MKTKIAIIAAAVMLSTSAFAAGTEKVNGGRVDFHGNVTAVSCTISVDGQGSDANVYLAPVSTAAFGSNSDFLNPTPFNIDVSKCNNEGDKTIVTKWTGGNILTGATGDTAGYLANDELGSTAQNVQLLLSTDRTIKNRIDPTSHEGNEATKVTADGVARYTYYVGYVTNDNKNVKAGKVHSYAVYEVSYK